LWCDWTGQPNRFRMRVAVVWEKGGEKGRTSVNVSQVDCNE
jgi:hypothetical protein